MRPLFILIFACFCGGKLCGQSFYVTDNNRKFQKITITNGRLEPPVPIPGCLRTSTAQSIAFQNNVMYYIDNDKLWKADLVNDALVNCQFIEQIQPFLGLTIDKKGTLYLTAGNGLLYTYDPNKTGSLLLKGTLPETPTSDMIFYKDELYVSTKKGILKVDIQNPSKSVLVIPTSEFVLGLAVVSVNSTSNKIYALEANESLTNTTVIELNLDNYRVGATLGQLGYFVFDAASNVEDGTYRGLNFKDIEINADCPFTGKGTVKVITTETASSYRYKLDNVENATGIFTNVTPRDYTVTITDGYETKQKTITVAPFQLAKPTLAFSPTAPKCLTKGSITVSSKIATDAADFTILFKGNSYPINHTFSDLTAGPYGFDILNKTGCIVDHYDRTLTQAACTIILDSTIVKQDCADPKKGAVTVYTSPGDDKYHFAIDGGSTQTSGVFEGLNPGTYPIKITSDGGGTTTTQAVIKDLSANDPQVSYQKTDVTCRTNGSVKFSIPTTNHTGYKIIYRSASYPVDHIFMFVDSGTYDFKIMKPGGCLLKEEKISITKQECEVVFFPNTFTPNNDGVNDIFRPKEGTVVKQLQLKIFDRSGSAIYTSDKAGNGWDGRYLGKPAPMGVYYWIATFINNEGLNTKQNGYITLLR